MAQDQAGERTEAPTQKRKQKAVDDGDLLKSKDFSAAIVVLTGCAWMALLGPEMLAACKGLLVASLTFGRGDVESFEPWRALGTAGWQLTPWLGSLLAMTAVAAIASQAVLGSLRFNVKLMKPKGSRLNPASGIKRSFGAQGWIELGKSMLKAVLLGSIGTVLLYSMIQGSSGLVATNLEGAVGSLGETFIILLFAMAAGLLAIAAIDLPIAMIRLSGRLKMSKQDVKDEHKQTEGSPEAKAAQRQRQRQGLKGGFRAAVAEAHVVLTNPTHFAVALRYDQGADQIPVVVAKGRGATALAIRELAAEMAVPVLEYPTLARAVYYTSREGQEVRDDLYLAIATVLAFVFNINVAAGGVQPSIVVPDGACFDENGRPQAETA